MGLSSLRSFCFVVRLIVALPSCMHWPCAKSEAMLGLAERRSSSSRITSGDGRALIMLLLLAMMSLSAHVALAARPSTTVGTPLLNSCAQPCRMDVNRTTSYTCKRTAVCLADRCRKPVIDFGRVWHPLLEQI